ncbi:aldehyde dehydrogenase [Actinospongicola halichondriae]|uniref:aldehyde dehydrogenase n=1 Tax=Actinospongicola halichondriae TaxID=3236844 RepID=UPI003D534C3E
MSDLLTHDTFFIGNEFVAPAGTDRIEVINPATEQVLGSCPSGIEADMDRAVAAAREAFDHGPWPRMSPSERADAIARLSAALQARGADIADIITKENGSPSAWSIMGQVFSSTMVLDAYVDIAKNHDWVTQRQGALSPVTVRKVPVGVCAGIIPWNVPLFISVLKLGPALSAGCCIVLKPAPDTPLDSYLLAEAVVEAQIPPGVVNIVAADRGPSEYLVRHPDVDKVSFTGSVAAGRKIGAICGEQLKRMTLELGGKSAAIILDDVDLDAVMGDLLGSGLMNNGQVCGAQSRLLISRTRYDEVVDAIGQAMAAMPVGDPLDPTTAIGPLVNASQRDRVKGYQQLGVEEGATVVTGGGQPDGPGYFIEPTLFANATNDMRIAREEIFGPVLTAIPYDDEADAVRIANDSDMGLCGSVWSADVDHAAELATQVRTGVVTINSQMILDMKAPFGGFKSSGVGRELGPEGIEPYTELQTIITPAG